MQLVENQYQQKSDVLYAFSFNKYYAYLLIDEPSNLEFLAPLILSLMIKMVDH